MEFIVEFEISKWILVRQFLYKTLQLHHITTKQNKTINILSHVVCKPKKKNKVT